MGLKITLGTHTFTFSENDCLNCNYRHWNLEHLHFGCQCSGLSRLYWPMVYSTMQDFFRETFSKSGSYDRQCVLPKLPLPQLSDYLHFQSLHSMGCLHWHRSLFLAVPELQLQCLKYSWSNNQMIIKQHTLVHTDYSGDAHRFYTRRMTIIINGYGWGVTYLVHPLPLSPHTSWSWVTWNLYLTFMRWWTS